MASTRRVMPEGAVELGAGSLVLADLHLHPDHEPRLRAFLDWLSSLSAVPHLVILGDLFDVWVGPAQARQSASAEVLAALAGLSARGTRIEIVPGNRDFLLDESFERRTGARLWPRGLLATTPARSSVLLIHGDELCTRDHAYQRMKRVLRSRPLRSLSRGLPLSVARWAASRLRAKSVRAVAQKPTEAKSMQAEAVRALALAHDAEILVCGHAHHFRDQQLDGGPRWIVLDAWGGERDLLIVADGSLEALRFARWADWSRPSAKGRASDV